MYYELQKAKELLFGQLYFTQQISSSLAATNKLMIWRSIGCQ